MTNFQAFFFFLGLFFAVRGVLDFAVLAVRLAWTLYRKPWLR